MNYEQFKIARESLSKLVDRQLNIVKDSNYDNIVKISPKPSDLLEKDKVNLDNEDLKVLVMGRFSSGKTTFLNAMLGDDILPMDVRPCTAVIGEISYSTNWDAVIFPKNGKAPFKSERHELKNLITIKHKDGDAEECPFDKVIIKSPLKICEHGIQFIDSPGLDDPTSHDEVTKSYLPNADAIIYCMAVSQAYTSHDKQAIEELRTLGYTSIIFVLTFFDQLEMNDQMYEQNEAEKCKKHYTDILSKLTDIGNNGVFFVSSLAALKAKKNGNAELMKKSHFENLETNLEKILIEQKGRLKLNKIFFETKRINVSNERAMSDIISVSEQDRNTLQQKVHQAEIPFNHAKNTAELIKSQVNSSCIDISENAKTEAELYYIQMISQMDAWVKDIKVDQPINNPLKIKGQVTVYTEQLLESLKVKMQSEVKSWADNKLAPAIERGINTLALQLDDKVKDCLSSLDQVKVSLDLPTEDIVNKAAPKEGEKIISVGASILIGDIGGALMGGTLGFKGLIRTLTCEVVAGVVLSIASMFTPVGLPALIIGTILAIVAGGSWGLATIKSEIKKKIIKELQSKLNNTEEKVKFANQTKQTVSDILGKIRTSIELNLTAPINQAKAVLDAANDNLRNQGGQLTQRISIYKSLVGNSHGLHDDLDNFQQNHLM